MKKYLLSENFSKDPSPLRDSRRQPLKDRRMNMKKIVNCKMSCLIIRLKTRTYAPDFLKKIEMTLAVNIRYNVSFNLHT